MLKIIDKEVLAVITALLLVGSIIYVAYTFRPKYVNPFNAIGLLNQDCKIGGYPRIVVNGETLRLCILLANINNTPALFKIVYRISTPQQLPNNVSPSEAPILKEFMSVLPPGGNTTIKIRVPIKVSQDMLGKRVALVFELWRYAPEQHAWIYTGKWVHIYVRVLAPP